MSRDRNITGDNKEFNKSPRIKPDNLYGNGFYSTNWKEIGIPENEENNHNRDQSATISSDSRRNQSKTWYLRNYRIWGYPDKRLYASPMLLGSAVLFIITLSLIIFPLLSGMPISYPAAEQNYSYSNNRALNFGEYIYNSTYLNAGSSISYDLASNVPITFVILNKPLINILNETKKESGIYNSNFQLNSQEAYSITPFLIKGDSINLTILNSQSIPFYIFEHGNTTPYSKYLINASSMNEVSFIAPRTDYYNFNWISPSSLVGSVDVTSIFQYNISLINFSNANVKLVNKQNMPENSYRVPKNGTYYFFIYTTSFQQSSKVLYIVTFHDKLYSSDTWKKISSTLIFIDFLAGMVILLVIYKRKKAIDYEYFNQEANNSDQIPQLCCPICGEIYKISDDYCQSCGVKLSNDNNYN